MIWKGSCPYSHKYQLVRWAYEHISKEGNPRKSLVALCSKKQLYYLWYNPDDCTRNTLYSMIGTARRKNERL